MLSCKLIKYVIVFNKGVNKNNSVTGWRAVKNFNSLNCFNKIRNHGLTFSEHFLRYDFISLKLATNLNH